MAPFWEDVDLSTPSSLRSPRDMVESLASPEGGSFSVSYARIPLSRERTPEAQDVAQLHQVRWGAHEKRVGAARSVGSAWQAHLHGIAESASQRRRTSHSCTRCGGEACGWLFHGVGLQLLWQRGYRIAT